MTIDAASYKSPVIAQAITQLIDAGIKEQVDAAQDGTHYNSRTFSNTRFDGTLDLEELGKYVAARLGF